MKTIHKSLAVALFVTIFSCSTKTTREEKFESGNPKIKFEVVEKKDGSFLKDGDYKVWFENGQIKVSGQYVDNKENENWVWYYNTGKICKEGTYKNGLKEGIWKDYEENGQITSQFTFASGELNGLQKTWYPNGQKKCEQNFLNGKANGLITIWDNEGNLKGEYEYEYGKNITVSGDYYHNWKSDTAKTSTLIWSFSTDGIAKRNYIPQTDMWMSQYHIENCSIYEDVENITVVEGEADNENFKVLFGNSKELWLLAKNDNDSNTIILRKINK